MPEIIKVEHVPNFLLENQIEPFREEYIPGSRVLSREGSDGDEVFFQIPNPLALKLGDSKLEELKKQVHAWWQTREDAG